MRRLALSLALLALLPLTARAEIGDLGSVLEPIRQETGVPCLAAAVTSATELIALGATGTRLWGQEVAATGDDKFHLGSCTKAMTADLIGMLVEEGRLAWSTPIIDVFPDLAENADPAWSGVTINHLLAMRGGIVGNLPEGLDAAVLGLPRRECRLGVLRAALVKPPAKPVGAEYEYSNLSFVILGCAIERLWDGDWEDLVRTRLFEPLGMETAGIGPTGVDDRTDQPWPHRTENGLPVPVPPGPWRDNHDWLAPAGKVHASLADWARFARMHLRGLAGEDGLLRAETIRHLHEAPFGGPYGGGWLREEQGEGASPVWSHAGSNTMNFALICLIPDADRALLCATNVGEELGLPACQKALLALCDKGD